VPERDEEANLAALIESVQAERPDFAFLYWPGLDGLLHKVGNLSPEISLKLRWYEASMARLLAVAKCHYAEVRLYIFSDHGMANCDELLDLKAMVESLPLRMPRDYAVVYDSTMARFWFFNKQARQQLISYLSQVPQGRILDDKELQELGTYFPDRYFGELIFLVREGVLIVPSHMGERPIRAMHGYHPNEKHSYAVLCTNQEQIPEDVEAIPDVFRLMTGDAELAEAQNSGARNMVLGAIT
jgi:predicted AlkP superfamily pyrophosphatase or phosphodiesterase